MKYFRCLAIRSLVAGFAALVASALTHANTPGAATKATLRFPNSIRAVPTEPTDFTGHAHPAFISRTTLKEEEIGAPMNFEVALVMRNFEELEARLAHSEIIAPEEMAARYLPLAIDHDRIVRWLQSEGVTVTRTDANHLAIFAQATVSEVARIFQANFARVTASGTEYTSAITAPSVPF